MPSSTLSTTTFVRNTPISPACSSKIASTFVASLSLICFLYACSDEIHQSFISGRDGNFLDVIIDSIGYLFGIFLYFGGHLWIKRKKNS